MMDQEEEADELFNEIRRGNSSALDRIRGRESEQLRQLMDIRRDGSNLLIFAIKNRKYKCVKAIFEIIKVDLSEDESSNILWARDDDGNDCLRLLMSNSITLTRYRVNLDSRLEVESENSSHEQGLIDKVFILLLSFDCISSKLAISKKETKETIQWAAKRKLDKFAATLLHKLPVGMQLEVIKQTETCEEDVKLCREGFNLLMLALEGAAYKWLVPAIIDTVCTQKDRAYKSELVMGKQKPDVFSKSANSLRLAAKMKKGELVMQLLSKCVPDSHQCDALLEDGPPGGSVMWHMLASDEITRLRGWATDTKMQNLQKSLQDPRRRRNFMQLEMSLAGIELFDQRLFTKRFLIPKPSELSRPLCMIFYNTNYPKDKLLRAPEEKDCLEKALNAICYNHRPTVSIKEWTDNQFTNLLDQELEEEKGRCSLFILCVTSHGTAGHSLGLPYKNRRELTSVRLDSITNAITEKLPDFIPKVLIFDMCRKELKDKTDMHATLKKNNVLLLSATMFGTKSEEMRYIPALASQIAAADGVTSLQKMHDRAAEILKNPPNENSEECQENPCKLSEPNAVAEKKPTLQFAHMESTVSRNIILRKYDDYFDHETTCAHCKHVSYNCECFVCGGCLNNFMLESLTPEVRQIILSKAPGMLCSTCNEMQAKF